MKTLPVCVLIPTMNRPETLKRTLQGYLNGEYIPSQIVVVDQTQDEQLREQVENILNEISGSITTKYVFQATPSLTKARNNSLQYAREEIIICSDDDIDVYSDTVKNVYEIMSRNDISMIAGIDDNTNKSSTDIGYILGTKSFLKRKIGHITLSMLGRYPDEVKGEVQTEWAMGYFFCVKKSLLEKWNLKWDENLVGYAYAEDLDFSYSYYKNAKREGLNCILSDKVRVKHLVSREYRTPSKKSTYMYVINRAYLSYKHKMGLKSRVAMGWCDFWRYIERALKRENSKDILNANKIKKQHLSDVKIGNIGNLY